MDAMHLVICSFFWVGATTKTIGNRYYDRPFFARRYIWIGLNGLWDGALFAGSRASGARL